MSPAYEENFTLKDGLLLYNKRLIMPNNPYLRTDLIREAYDQVFIAYPGRDKTYKLLRSRYYWRNIASNIARYV